MKKEPTYIKIKKYVFRSWEEEPKKINRSLQILPPFLIEILSYIIVVSVIIQIAVYLLKFI
jgi:hypothetical protein